MRKELNNMKRIIVPFVIIGGLCLGLKALMKITDAANKELVPLVQQNKKEKESQWFTIDGDLQYRIVDDVKEA